MQLKNCPECGKLFACISRSICPECIAKEDEMINLIKCHIEKHKNATITEISQGTGIPREKIVSLLQDGRLIIKSSTRLLNCERCGTPIPYGRFCTDCTKMLTKSFEKAITKGLSPEGEKLVPEPEHEHEHEHEEDKKETRTKKMYVRDFHRKMSR